MTDYGSIPLEGSSLQDVHGDDDKLREPLLSTAAPHRRVSIKSYDDLLLERDGYAWDYALVFPNPLPTAETTTGGGFADVLPKLQRHLPSNPLDKIQIPHLQAAGTTIVTGLSLAQTTVTTGLTTVLDTTGISTGINTVLDVFRTSAERLSIEEICHRIHGAGLELRLFYSSRDPLTNHAPYILCQVRAPPALLKHEADRIDIQRLMDKDALAAVAATGYPAQSIAPFPISDVLGQYRLSPYEYIHMTYTERPDMQSLYARAPNGLFFTGTERILLVESLLSTGAGLDLVKLEAHAMIVAAFPLHCAPEKAALADAWLRRRRLFHQPISQIEGYFGPKVALYFAFLGHYARWLAVAGTVGAAITLAQWLNVVEGLNLGDHVLQCLVAGFSVFMVLWSTTMLETWKKENARLAMEWGTTQYTEEERPRPQFVGTVIPSPITGKPMLHFDRKEQRKRVFQSWLVLLLLVVLVLLLVAFTFFLRFYMAVRHKEDFAFVAWGTKVYYGGPLASIGNVVQIAVMAELYDRICMKMNDYENHATESAHEGAFILKSVIFHIVNNFAALFYITFVKSSLSDDTCENNDCLQELRTTLIIIFGTQLLAGNLQEVWIPRAMIYWAKRQAHTNANKDVHVIEAEFFLNDYGWRGTYNDYLEMILQFGFTVLFVGAFPATPLFSLLNNVLEIRIDATRLLTDYRRPTPRPVVDMGAWITVLDVLATLAIATNGYVMVYTSGVFDAIGGGDVEEGKFERLLLFLGFFATMLLLRYSIWAYMEKNVSVEVRAQLKRQAFLSAKVYAREADDVVLAYAHDANYRFEILESHE